MQNRKVVSWGICLLVLVSMFGGMTGPAQVIPVHAQDGSGATVIPALLNMRHGPGDEYAVIAKLTAGTRLVLLARDDIDDNGLWVFARSAQGPEGWLYAEYIEVDEGTDLGSLPVQAAPSGLGTPMSNDQSVEEPVDEPAASDEPLRFPEGSGVPAQTLGDVNQRSGPGTGYRVFQTVPSGTSLLVKGRDASGEWIFGQVGAQDGWLYVEFVRLGSGFVSNLPVVNTIVQQQAAPETDSGSDGAAASFIPAPVAGGSGLGSFGYGGHVDSFSYPGLMAQAGMTWVKRQVRFSQGQPGSSVDWMIAQAHENGFKILLGVVGHTWEMNNPGYYEDYARFVGEVAALGPDAIEVWNEQNIDREWPNGQIDPARYTQLLAQAYNAIKSVNPNVAVISGAPAPTGAEGAFGTAAVWNDDRYVQGMAAAGARQYMDCVGAHYNEGIVPPSWTSGDPRGNYYTRYFWGMVNTYSRAFGGALPVCFTELGYLTPEGFGPLPGAFAWAADTSLSEQAAWVSQAVNLSRSSGRVKLVIIWNIDFTNYDGDPMAGYAVVRPGGGCPACDALAGIR